jgi:hypothetical protein
MLNPLFATKPTGQGAGLGLSMTHDVIVFSNVPKGSASRVRGNHHF